MYVVGRGSNTKVEFVALWVLLTSDSHKGFKRFQVMGYSKLVIDWDNKKNIVEIVHLNHLLEVVRKEIQMFKWTSFTHVYREL